MGSWMLWAKVDNYILYISFNNASVSWKQRKHLWVKLKAPYPSKIDILLSKKGLINWYTVLI